MSISQISPLPQPPQRSDAPDIFAGRADAFVAALVPFRDEANALASDVDSAIAGNLVQFDGFAGVWSAGTFNAGQVVFHTPTDAFYIALQDGETAEPPNGDWRKVGTAESTPYDNSESGLVADNVQDAIDEVKLTAVPSGAIQYFATQAAPSGWLKANGADVSRTTYSALFDAIGTTFGAGNGSSTFTLPDLRGEFMRGWDDGRGVDSGRVFGSNQQEEIGPHNHPTNAERWFGLYGVNFGDATTNPEGTDLYIGFRSASVSNNNGTENRPRNIALLACIKF